MVEITHQQARTLLQAAADRPLGHADSSALDAHLAACKECSKYADNLAGLEISLRKIMRSKWDRYRPALNPQAIKNPSPLKLLWNNLFSQTHAFGKVTVIIALLLGYFVIIDLIGVRVPISNDETPTSLPTPNESLSVFITSPTPSTQSTHLELTSLSCKTFIYVVQANDTLESIAVRHGITREAILAYNPEDDNLAANTVFTGTELLIPLCKGTPVHTASLPGNTLTLTPIRETIFPELPE